MSERRPTSPNLNSRKPRHISIVTETYPPEINGVATTLARLVDGLRERGYRVSLVRPRQEVDDCFVQSQDFQGALVGRLPLPGYRGLHIGRPAGKTLRRYWSRHIPDVVYVATQGPLGWSAVRAARFLRIAVFSGFHTNFDEYARHYHAGWLRSLILRYLKTFHSRSCGTIVPSADLRERLSHMGLQNISVLGRGVDTRLFNPEHRNPGLRREWCAGEDDLVALYVGRIAAEKNLALAIDAYRAMQRVNPTVRFVLVGDGPLRSTLQKKHSDLIFCGTQTGAALARHYASADVFLFPSETETFGNVTLEAMASALAVLAYDYAAARSHIKDGETGVLAPYSDSQAFISAATSLAVPRRSLETMRRQARIHAMSLDWQRVVDRFAAILLSPLKQESSIGRDTAPIIVEASTAMP